MSKKLGGYLKPWQVSQYLGIPVEQVYAMLESQELPGEKIEGHWRVSLEKLEAWLDEEVPPQEIEKLAQRLNVSSEKVQEFFRKTRSSS
ncbi:MAG: helix-turn-helix domain-containing protein [Candidatus Bipolaricaulota bacterium]|nr:helix-turn-helix domain-containing protein [Candidatus Bipolaricaulota bacterium]MCS7273885.1 helix-turn-helix domain-containing protein [Candidatus Bipolaricaulota bacterium]MDW8110316.1 helix-turn-helix domain-containing protein [Candidatus Bipolaricaulota bacterium]MDW8328788.1 helix-turn-helix domain-containing protein [Candidatus Bipolaricaulota bacterium]